MLIRTRARDRPEGDNDDNVMNANCEDNPRKDAYDDDETKARC